MKISKLQLVYLAVLSMLGFVATDMYLPAFKAMEIDFATGPEQIALSLTVFLGGMAFGQLMWGLASDKFGHRNTLAAGLVCIHSCVIRSGILRSGVAIAHSPICSGNRCLCTSGYLASHGY